MNNYLIKSQSSSSNNIQRDSNDEEKSLKIVIPKNTQKTPNVSPDWIIKTGKSLSFSDNSTASKGNNINKNKFTYTTQNRYETLNITETETETNIENEEENEKMQSENTILPQPLHQFLSTH